MWVVSNDDADADADSGGGWLGHADASTDADADTVLIVVSIRCCYQPVVIWDNTCVSIVYKSGDGGWYRAVMWRMAIVESLSSDYGLKLLVGAIQRPCRTMRPPLLVTGTVRHMTK